MWNPTETNCSEIPNDRTAHIRSIFHGSKFDNRETFLSRDYLFHTFAFFFRDLELTADQTLKIFKIVSEFEKFRVFKKNFAIFERRRIFIKIILVFRVLELIRNGILEILRLFWEFRKCRNSKFDWCWILKI